MPKTIVFLEEQPVVTIDGEGVKITYTSGDETYCRRCSRAYFRRHIETSLALLNEHDRREREKVVPFKGKRARH